MRILSSIAILSFLGGLSLAPVAAAVVYPTNTPFGETPGGTFQTYFDNMYATTQCNASLQVVAGFSPTGVPICVTPTAAGFSLLGQTSGDTVRFNGTDWIRTNFLYNNGANIGINTQSPTATLDVNGQIRIRGGAPAAGRFLISDATGTASWTGLVLASGLSVTGSTLGSTLYYNGTDWVPSANIYNTGSNVGIGTTTPGAKLEVAGQLKITGGGVGSGRFLVSDATGLASWTNVIPATTFSISGQTLGAMAYYDGSNWMASNNVFNTGGNIGIGTTSPQALLDISGSFRINHPSVGSGRFLVSDANGVVSWTDNIPATTFSISGSTLGATLYYDGSNWVPSLNIYNTGGNVGIGITNPQNKLSISANGTAAIPAVTIGNNPNTGWFRPAINTIAFSTNGAERLRILANGNIGVGTASPSTRLHVNGQVRITGGTPDTGRILTAVNNTGLAVWSNTFSGSVTASGIIGGTENYVTKFGPGGNGIINSQIFDDGNGVSIGSSSIGGRFEVWNGADSIFHARGVNNIGIGLGASRHLGTGGGNIGLGNGTLANRTTGNSNLALGNEALHMNTVGDSNIALGDANLWSNISGSNNIAIGPYVLTSNATGNSNIALGLLALLSNTSGSDNIAMGNFTLSSNISGGLNVAIGDRSMQQNTLGSYNVAYGASALGGNIAGNDNVALGFSAMSDKESGSDNVAIGSTALLYMLHGSRNTAIGTKAGLYLSAGTGNTLIGYDTQAPVSTGSNQLNIANIIYGNGLVGSGDGNIGIGVTNPTVKLEVGGQIRITGGSPAAGRILTSDATGLATWSTGFSGSVTASGITGGTQNYVTKFGTGGNGLVNSQIFDSGTGISIGSTDVGSRFEVWSGAVTMYHTRGVNNIGIGLAATRRQTTGTANVGLGNNALRTLTTGYSNTAVGDGAGYGTTAGFFNSALGSQALYSNNNGNWNVALGTQTLWTNLGGGYNIAIGGQALYSNTSQSNNVAIGYQALRANLADNNVAIGHSAGSGITSGSNNIVIGAGVTTVSNTASNQLNIGNWIYGSGGRISMGRSTMSSGAYRLDIANGFVNSSSGYCIDNVCIPNWSGIFDAINGAGNYIPKWNTTGTGLIASRISDDGIDIAISSGALQQVIITPANQDQFQQVIISTGGILKKGLTSREKLRIFAFSDYGPNNDNVSIQELCFDNSTNTACRVNTASNPLTNVPNFNVVDPKSYTGGIGEYFPATTTRPAMFVSYYTGTYMIVNSYTFSSSSFTTADDGCNVFPYYSLFDSPADISNLVRANFTPPVRFTINSNGAIANVYSSTNLSLPRSKTTRVGSQFVSNVFMTPGQALLMTIGVQSCASRADRSMRLVTNDQRKMTLSITEL